MGVGILNPYAGITAPAIWRHGIDTYESMPVHVPSSMLQLRRQEWILPGPTDLFLVFRDMGMVVNTVLNRYRVEAVHS